MFYAHLPSEIGGKLQLIVIISSDVQENVVDSFSRPEFLGQRVHGHHPSGPVQALVLQGQLLHVQEDGGPETERVVEGVREAGEADQRSQSRWKIKSQG